MASSQRTKQWPGLRRRCSPSIGSRNWGRSHRKEDISRSVRTARSTVPPRVRRASASTSLTTETQASCARANVKGTRPVHPSGGAGRRTRRQAEQSVFPEVRYESEPSVPIERSSLLAPNLLFGARAGDGAARLLLRRRGPPSVRRSTSSTSQLQRRVLGRNLRLCVWNMRTRR